MRTKIMIGSAIAASAALGAFAATGFGDGSGTTRAVNAVEVAAHEVSGPPAGAKAVARRASLFKVIYKETDPTPLPAGTNVVTVRSCPRGAGVLSGWFIRNGQDKSAMYGTGGTPDGVRKWVAVVTNNAGAGKQARFGIICIK
jgi:hypothetical protein